MDSQNRRQQILVEMARIDAMEKGRLTEEYRDSCRDGNPVKLGPYYKHQCWESGKNVSRRVPVAEAQELRQAVDGYHRFRELAEEYAEVTVGMTRCKSTGQGKKKPG